MAVNIGPKIGIDGENEYRKQIQNIIQSTKTLKSELQAVSSEATKSANPFKELGNELSQNKQKRELLSQAIEEQKAKLTDLQHMEEISAKELGENATTTLKWKQAVADATTELNKMESELSQIPSSLETVGNKMSAVGDKIKSVGDGMKSFGNTMTAKVTTPIAGAFGAAVKVSMDFESSMSNVRAISGATGEQMEALEQKARDMGATTKFSASEAGDAMGYMAMAGWKSDQMIAGLDGILNLAAASNEDLATTSDIVTDALTAFGMTAEQSGHFADVLAATASNANTNVSMMGESFQYVAPLAGAMGYSAEDTSVALGLMANAGIKASSSGTALRTLLTNMAKPTDQMENAMRKLGISLDDEEGNMYSLREVMDQLRTGFNDLKITDDEFGSSLAELNGQLESGEIDMDKYSDQVLDLIDEYGTAEGALQAQYAAMLAGKTGLSGLMAIVNASDDDYAKLTEAIDGSSEAFAKLEDGSVVPLNEALASGQNIIAQYNGQAEATAAIMQDNLSGQLTELMSGVQELGIQLGETLVPIAKDLVAEAKEVVTWFQSLDDATKENIVKIGLLVAAAGPLISVIGSVLSVGGTLISGAGQLITLLPTIGGALSAVGALVTGTLIPAAGGLIAAAAPILAAAAPFIALGAAIVGAGVLVYQNWDTIKEKAGQLKDWLGEKWENIKTGASEAWESVKSDASEKWEEAKAAVTSKVDEMKTAAQKEWEEMKTGASEKFEAVRSVASEKWGLVKDAVGIVLDSMKINAQQKWDAMKAAYEQHGGGLKGAAAAMWTGIQSVYQARFDMLNSLTGGKLGELASKFTDLANKALSWGKDMIQNFINGITSKFSSLKSVASEMAGMVKDFIGFSEPKEGPLSNFHTFAPDMMKLYAQGIEDNIRMVEDAVSNAAASIGAGMFGNTQYTNNVGGVSITVNAAQGQSVNELADVIEDRINRNVMLSMRAM